ncbi:hypothetical protein M0811_05728 [Anaeramoeba ignava]|uniref:FYVE-type domain-containing protein n=1 Tax=Anaeramoeba ignava TaxID=1746090 RepID=A0A9Q0LSB4_ANAIG|nr:hypothetical protein M0811_05728 [Anaeramoeba ignava]
MKSSGNSKITALYFTKENQKLYSCDLAKNVFLWELPSKGIKSHFSPKKQAYVCYLCLSKFKSKRKKHHCKRCGQIVCPNCSQNRLILPNLHYFIPVRICDQCSRILK